MDDQKIKEGFLKLGIMQNNVPYLGAEEFAKNFKQCTILKTIPTTYSASSQPDLSQRARPNNGPPSGRPVRL